MIQILNLRQPVLIDRDVRDALFLRRNSGWKPEDLGYPPGDFILLDLMRLID